VSAAGLCGAAERLSLTSRRVAGVMVTTGLIGSIESAGTQGHALAAIMT